MTMMLDHNDLIWFLLPSERNSCGERTPNQSGLTGIQKVLDPKERAAKKNRERWSLTGSFFECHCRGFARLRDRYYLCFSLLYWTRFA